MQARRKQPGNEITLRPVHPNVGLQVEYERKLDKLIDAMSASVLYWVKASYRANEPEMAADESPAVALRNAMRRLTRQWQSSFDKASSDLAKWFAQAASDRSDAALRSILKKGGFTVEFKLTPAANDILQATIAQNVSLIKSIPERYLTNVQGAVMRSVQAGRDLGQLTKDLVEQHGVARRRAAFISLDQNNKITAAITRVRQTELGITTAKWRHSGGGKHPRPSHVAMSGKTYDIKQGMWDPAVKRYIIPGEEPGCRCVSVSMVKGFS